MRPEMHTYAGGLGVLAGDTARSCADLELQVVFVTLVSHAGYFRQLPQDPITNSSQTWETVADTSVTAPDQTESGIIDVHSGSTAISSEGTPYNTW